MKSLSFLLLVLLSVSCDEDYVYEMTTPLYYQDSSIITLKNAFRNHSLDSAALLSAYEFQHRFGLHAFFWEDTTKPVFRHVCIINSKIISDEKLQMNRKGEMVSNSDSAHYRITPLGVDTWMNNPAYTSGFGTDHGNVVSLYHEPEPSHILVSPPAPSH